MPRGGRRPGAGRPPGRVSQKMVEIRALAKQYGPAVITRLAELSGVLPPAPPADSQAVQVMAMKELLDRGYGRTRPLANDSDGPLIVDFRWSDGTTALPPLSRPARIIEAEPADGSDGAAM